MIYFIQSGGFVKIGYCDRDPIRRLEKLQIGNPIKLRLIALMTGGPAEERELHDKYRHNFVRGEWFKLTREMIEADLYDHLVDHRDVSSRRPTRKIEGVDARRVHAFLQLAAEGRVVEKSDRTVAEIARLTPIGE